MNFVFALDRNIVQHLAVTLVSLFEVHRDVDIEVFFMFIDVPEAEVDRIDTLCRQFPKVKTYFHAFSIPDAHRFPISGHVSVATYARVFLTDVLPAKWSRVIYLDCDLIVRCSFAEIWDRDWKMWQLPVYVNPVILAMPNSKSPLLLLT